MVNKGALDLKGIITKIERCSTEDGPGIRTTLFLKGCPMSCLWCHNVEAIDDELQLVWHKSKCIGDRACIQACHHDALDLTGHGMNIDYEKCVLCGACEAACPSGALEIIGTEWSAKKLVEELARDAVFFEKSGGGVTFSGGEPTHQLDFVEDVAKGLHEMGIHVALDTCGYCPEKEMLRVVNNVDLVLYDLKVLDPQKHRQYTGVSLDIVLSNARLIADRGIPAWVRTPVIPGYTDSDQNIINIARFIRENMPNVRRYDLLAFNRMCTEKYHLIGREFPLSNTPLMTKDRMDELADLARAEGLKVVEWSGMIRRKEGRGAIS